jgi:hypothetical protein
MDPDFAEWQGLRVKARESVVNALAVCKEVWKRTRRGWKKTRAAKEVGQRVGWHWQKVLGNWEAYSLAFDWRALVNRTYEPRLWRQTTEHVVVQPAVIERFQTLCQEYPRDSKAAHRILLAELEAWRKGDGPGIPGLATPSANAPGKNHPTGWSYANLKRHCPTPKRAPGAPVAGKISPPANTQTQPPMKSKSSRPQIGSAKPPAQLPPLSQKWEKRPMPAYLELENAVNSAAALLELYAEKVGQNYAENCPEYGDTMATGIESIARDAARELHRAFCAAHEEWADKANKPVELSVPSSPESN